jgi:hypothetical protein
MAGSLTRIENHHVPLIVRRLTCAALLISAFGARTACAQTPSPMQEWQYSGGIILARLFEPNLPDWRNIVGAAAETQPAYTGAHAYKVQGGPVINIQYKDIAFASTGDGIGINFLRGDHYRVGVAIAYDLGRREGDDYTNLRGMGDISAAPPAKLFATYVLSKKFPLTLRVDARQILGGADGTVPGLRPSGLLCTRGHGIGRRGHQRHPISDGSHWLLNIDAAIAKLKGSPDVSPITETSTQRELALSIDYQW